VRKGMKEPCDFCEGHLESRHVRVVRSRGRRMVVIENVPALQCNRCGMRYYDSSVVRSMEAILKKRSSTKRMLRVPVRKFVVVA